MRTRRLPHTDLDVSVICQGCWSITGGRTWGPQDRDDSVAALRAAYEAGINFFDTAELYGEDGESERLIARALGDRPRDRLVIATKVSSRHLRPADLRAACEASLTRLGLAHIDLYQIHWPNPEVPIADTLGAMEALRAEGKIRAIGVSNFGAGRLLDLLRHGRAVSNQVAYSLLFRPPEHEVIPLCREHGLGVLAYSPLAQGLLTGKFATADEVPEGRARTRHFSSRRPGTVHGEAGCEAETFAAVDALRDAARELGRPMAHVALAWLLAQPGLTSAIVGARTPEQARDNAAAADLALPDPLLAALARAAEPVKRRLGRNCDPWQVPSRMGD